MEEILNLVNNTQAPLLVVLLLGLLIALNPCQLAISFSALTYLTRNSGDEGDEHKDKRKNAISKGLVFALGKAATYLLMGIAVLVLVQIGLGQERLEAIKDWEGLETLERILPFVMLLFGLFFLFRAFFHHHHHNDSCHNSGTVIRHRGSSGAFWLGMLLALLFCPESAVMYFGITLPVCLSAQQGILLLVVFALATSLPVLLLTYLMTVTQSHARRFGHRMEHLQQWLNILTALLFIAFAIYLWLHE